jgi:predicted ATPase
MENEARSNMPGFGKLLRDYRLAAGLSQEALADRARMSIEGISALERGYRRSPQRETRELLAGALALNPQQRRDFELAARAAGLRRPGPASVTVGPWPQADTASLPLALTTYVGRESDMVAISALLREHRLVTLTGAGGVGKTRAALQAADALGDDWDYPPRFVSLSAVADASSVTQTVAASLGVQEVPSHSLVETLRSYLESKAVLLILDNCEHVIEPAAQLAEALLSSCPRVRILATSREPLRIAGEHAYRLPSLAVPPPHGLHRLTASGALEYGAIRLFVDRARAVNHRFELTDEHASIVAELCGRLDGMPLAIELAAARANSLSVQALTERLAERFRLLTGGERTALPRQQTMRAAIDWSYDLLSANERRIFERLSVFAGGCTLAVAARVCGDDDAREADVFDALCALADKSLVLADLNNGETRYRLLESFRQYAREKLAERGETNVLARRHALAYLEMAKALDRGAEEKIDEIWRAPVGSELENWRAALEWTLTARNDVVLGQELAAELNRVWQAFAPVEGRRWLRLAAEHSDKRTPPAVLAALSFAQANLELMLRDYAAQLAFAQTALALCRRLGDPTGIARAQSRAGVALVSMGRIPEGTALLHESLDSAQQMKNRRLTTFLLRALGLASAQNHDYETARRYAAEAVQILETMGASLTAAAAMEDLAEYEFAAGNREAAARHTVAIVTTIREAGAAPRSLAVTLNALAYYRNALMEYDEAEQCAAEALDIAWRHDLHEVANRALQRLAATAALRVQASARRSEETWTRIARVLGFVNAAAAAMRGKPMLSERREYDSILMLVRGAIGEAALDDAMTAGSALTQDQAIDESFALGAQ